MLKRITVNDRHTYAITSREYTDEGFLKVPGRVARTGVQEYLASELGITDCAPNKIIKVMRLDSDVFNSNSLDSYDGADITVEHPKSFVDAQSYKSLSVGTVRGSGVKDGDFVLCDLYIKDNDAIKIVESGKVQLSAGYSAVYDEAPSDAPYDYIQTDIKINHVALVDRARAGHQARLFDNHHRGKRPMIKISLDSGSSVEIEDGATATLVQDSFARLEKRATDAEGSLEKVTAAKDSLEETVDKLTKQSSDEAVAAKVKEVTDAQTLARKIAGKEFSCDSVVVVDIQRAALAITRDSVEWAEKSEIYVQAAFDMEIEKASEDEDEDEEDKKKSSDSYSQLAADAAAKAKEIADADATPSAKQKFHDSKHNSWKKTVGEA